MMLFGINPLQKSAAERVSKTRALFTSASSSKAKIGRGLLPRFITLSIEPTPCLLSMTFKGKYAGGVAKPSVTSLINCALLVAFKA